MFCSHCGKQVDSGKFCPYCGSPLTQAQTPHPVPQQTYPTYTPTAPPVQYAQSPMPQRSPENASLTETLSRLGGSTLMLVGAIAVTLSILVSVIVSTTSGGLAASSLQKMLETLQDAGIDVSSLPSNLESTARGTGIFSAVLSMIPSILVAAGIWMVYKGSRDRNRDLSANGLSMLRIMQIIELVFICIGAFFMILVFVAVMALAANYTGGGSREQEILGHVAPVLSIILVLVLALFVLVIVYEAKLIKTIKTMRDTVTSGIPSDRVSTFVTAILFLCALFELIGGFSLLSIGGWSTAALQVLNAVSSVCFGILILNYKNAMRSVMTASSAARGYPNPEF